MTKGKSPTETYLFTCWRYNVSMSFMYSRVPTQWSPNDTYQVSNGMYLKPAGRIAVENYPSPGSIQYFDITFFVTEGDDKDEHIKRLKEWIVFHSFMFHESHACYFLEDNMISRHAIADSLEAISDVTSNPSSYPLDYDNIGQQVYWLYKGHIPIISYRVFPLMNTLTTTPKSANQHPAHSVIH